MDNDNTHWHRKPREKMATKPTRRNIHPLETQGAQIILVLTIWILVLFLTWMDG